MTKPRVLGEHYTSTIAKTYTIHEQSSIRGVRPWSFRLAPSTETITGEWTLLSTFNNLDDARNELNRLEQTRKGKTQ